MQVKYFSLKGMSGQPRTLGLSNRLRLCEGKGETGKRSAKGMRNTKSLEISGNFQFEGAVLLSRPANSQRAPALSFTPLILLTKIIFF